jgi:hypothetical protein
MTNDPFCDPEFQLDFQSGAFRQELLGHGGVRVNLPVPTPGASGCRCPESQCLLHGGESTGPVREQ